MGARGPVPNREDDLARPRERGNAADPGVTKGTLRPVEIPNPNPEWHHICRWAWDSLATSGMEDFYQNSDWMYAYIVLDELNGYLTPSIDREGSKKASKEAGYDVVVRYPERKLSGMTFTAIMSALSNLGMTEGDRRRMRIELTDQAPEDEGATVLSIVKNLKEQLD